MLPLFVTSNLTNTNFPFFAWMAGCFLPCDGTSCADFADTYFTERSVPRLGMAIGIAALASDSLAAGGPLAALGWHPGFEGGVFFFAAVDVCGVVLVVPVVPTVAGVVAVPVVPTVAGVVAPVAVDAVVLVGVFDDPHPLSRPTRTAHEHAMNERMAVIPSSLSR